MSNQSASNFMRIADRFKEDSQRVGSLSYRALIALSSDSTPEPVREQALERAAKGEKVTARDVEGGVVTTAIDRRY